MHFIALAIFAIIPSSIAIADTHAVIFTYHHVGVSKHPPTNVTLEEFDTHLAFLNDAGYTIRPLTEIVTHIQSRQPLPPYTVAITFDDAYRSVYESAYPRLRSYSWPFTVFVNTDPVDKNLPAYITWQQMREMQQYGATFANHSASHEHLVGPNANETHSQWRARVTADINRAQQRLAEELGHAPLLFAYPYGEYSTELANLVEALGYVGLGQQSGAIGPFSDFRALPRFPVGGNYAAIGNFRIKAASLPMPVERVTPWDPVRKSSTPPRLEVQLTPNAEKENLACFVSGQGQVNVVWVSNSPPTFTTEAMAPLPLGRSRYNCTARAKQSGRYYWFSHPWLRQP